MVRAKLRQKRLPAMLPGGVWCLPAVRANCRACANSRKKSSTGRRGSAAPCASRAPRIPQVRNRGGWIIGLAEATSGPAFATTAGLLAAALQPEHASSGRFGDFAIGGQMLSRVGQWIKQNM